MLRRSACSRSYQRGNWKPGSKHQKHQMMNPVPFLYRFAGPRGPGPYTMKYWWTLGCMPSGKEVPFRLPEFLALYQQQHVPIEVEEWLDTFVVNPAESLGTALEQLLAAMEDIPEMEQTVGYQALEPSIAPLTKPLLEVERCLSLVIPRTALRSVLSTPALRKRAMDELYEFKETVQQYGSTAHRRLGFEVLTQGESKEGDHKKGPSIVKELGGEERRETSATQSHSAPFLFESLASSLTVSSSSSSSSLHTPTPTEQPTLTEQQRDVVRYAVGAVPPHTSDDERQLIRFMTTIAEGSMKRKKFDDAASLLSSLLLFVHDDDVRAEVCGCIATAHNRNGTFQEAEFYGREAALLKRCRRGYVNWATAVAFQDDFDRAERILDDALVQHEGDPMLLAAQEGIRAAAAKAKDTKINAVASIPLQTPRAHTDAQRQRGLETGSGRSFLNEFDYVVFNQRMYAPKMDPTSGELGSVFRRVGTVNHVFTSTKSMEQF